ncbi:hypothetical protein KC850_03935, partial [Candidatus Kaiserbacteria bacterium]|nr:hypothetical protein [Candidatus Kaiserbacteria bacterium]
MINSIFRRHLKFILVGVLLGLLASAVVSYLNYAEKETAQVIDSQGGTIESQETLSEPVPEDV